MNTGGLQYQFKRLSIAEKLIAINVLVFILNALLPFLFKMGPNAIEQWFWMPKSFFDFLSQPWAIITYSFFHVSFWHLLSNMLILYYMSKMVLNLFDEKRFLSIYFFGVILGGIVFLLSYNIFPAFLGENAPMIGASAGVMAVLIFIATYRPNQEIRLFFFNVKLWHIGAFFVLKDLIEIPIDGNAGGHFAHLGGAFIGYLYARQLSKGNDIGNGFSKFLDSIFNMFDKKERRAPLKTVYKKQKTQQKATITYAKENNQRQIDTILDKISKSGYESLSKTEKDFLFKVGKED